MPRVVPAQAEQADIIADTLPRMGRATLLLVTLTVAICLRSLLDLNAGPTTL